MQPLEQLYKQISVSYDIDGYAWADMSSCWHEINVDRKGILTKEDEIEKYMYFVLDGVQRAYVENRGKESTLIFSYTNSFSGIVDSFLLQQPSRYCLEALTSSRLLRIHYNDFSRLMKQYPSIEKWVRVAITYALAGTLERNIELLSYNAEERFTTLLRRSPQVLNLIPHKYLASYIGVDPTTFSKMLSSIRI